MADRTDLIAGVIGVTIETAATFLAHDLVAPAAGFVGTAIAQYLLGRFSVAKEILRSELERAGATTADFRDADQFAAGALRYMRAARDQAADENLRILAQAMIGCARRQELWASDFLRYAEILAPLTCPELTLIGMFIAAHRLYFSQPRQQGEVFHVWAAFINDPKVTEQIDWPDAVAAQAQRSGLIAHVSGIDGESYYALTDTAIQLGEFVDIESVIKGTDIRAEP